VTIPQPTKRVYNVSTHVAWTLYLNTDREDASSIVTTGATANTREGNSRASRESGLLCSHSHGEYIDTLISDHPHYTLQVRVTSDAVSRNTMHGGAGDKTSRRDEDGGWSAPFSLLVSSV